MASRQDTQKRRDELRGTLLAHCRDGTLVSEQPLAPVRTLAVQFNLSVPTVRLVIKELMDQGFLHTRSTAGTFVGPDRDKVGGLYLVLTPYPANLNTQYAAACHGFEERIAQLGGNSLILDWQQAHDWQNEGRLPRVRGVFELGRPVDSQPCFEGPDLPRVVFAEQNVTAGCDTVRFDNFDGGRQAAMHLLKAGHRQVGFLGLHGRNHDLGDYAWSAQREAGWNSALLERGLDNCGLSFLPERPGGREHESQFQNALGPAHELVSRQKITAIVSVNPIATSALTQALHESGLPPERWPAMVSFDDGNDAITKNNLTITVVRLPWDKLGREAAEMLWQRSLGGPESQVSHLVPMLLISRLSCHSPWSLTAPAFATVGTRVNAHVNARAA